NFDAYTENFSSFGTLGSSSAYYLSTDTTITTADMLLATTITGSLAVVSTAGYYQQHVMSVTMAGNLAPGTYYLGGIADYTNQYSETNETNNTYNVVQIVVGAGPQPDYSEYIVAKNTTAYAGGTLSFDAYTENFGNVTAA